MNADRTQGIAWAILPALILLGSLSGAMAQSQAKLILAWNPSAAGDVAGYRLYEGVASGVYSIVLDVSTNTTATVSGLTNGATYYFAVTAYTSDGLESAFSGEISYTVPAARAAKMHVAMNSQTHTALITGIAPAGYQYEVLASQDLHTWNSIGRLTINSKGSFQFTDPSPPSRIRYY